MSLDNPNFDYNNYEQNNKKFFTDYIKELSKINFPKSISREFVVSNVNDEWFDLEYENFYLKFNHYWSNVLELEYLMWDLTTKVNFSYNTLDKESIIHYIDLKSNDRKINLSYNAWLSIDISSFNDDLRVILEKIKTLDWYNSIDESTVLKLTNFVDEFFEKIDFVNLHDNWYMQYVYPKLPEERKNDFANMLYHTNIAIY